MHRIDHAGPVELRAMQSVAERAFAVTGYRAVGDLAWNRCLQHDQPEQGPTAVWRDGDRPVAWGWLELPDALMMQVDPAYPDLAGDVLDWAARRVAGGLSVEVCQTETAVLAALRQRGYVRQDGPFLRCLRRSAAGLPPVSRLPDGYRLRELRGPEDVGRRAAVHRAAFGSSRMTAERHALLMRTWPYRPEFDLVVEAPGGGFAAYCQGWYDAANRTGQFEPVGTHPEHRRRGLARAVCVAVLHAFATAGARHAVVQCRGDAAYPGPALLYGSIGFVAQARTMTYHHEAVARSRATVAA